MENIEVFEEKEKYLKRKKKERIEVFEEKEKSVE